MFDFVLKPKRNEETDAIIITFHSKWEEPMKQNAFSVVFRKHYPERFSVRWIYAHLTRPVSTIAAKLSVTAVEHLTIDEAVTLSVESMHREEEIRKYAESTFRPYEKLVVYHIEHIYNAKHPILFKKLKDEYGYWPSSSFFPLSNEGEDLFDEMAGFE